MDFIVCAYGEPAEIKFIKHIEGYVAGFELINCNRKGILSEKDWEEMLEKYRMVITRLPGRLVLHGPYIGIYYGYKDHLLKDAVNKRMDMTYDMVCELKPDTLVLHTGCSEIMIRFGVTDTWLEHAVEFWRNEIVRYAAQGIRVVLENVAEQTPDLMIALADHVNHELFGLCFDIGHAHLCSSLPPVQWIQKMGRHLKHIHIHDNNGQTDEHLPIGQGKIDFETFFNSLFHSTLDATVSLEVDAAPEIVVENIKHVIKRYGSKVFGKLQHL